MESNINTMSSLLLLRRSSVTASSDHSSSSIISTLPQPLPGRGLGSSRGHVACDVDITHLVSYWNDPRSTADHEFQSPFSTVVLNEQHPKNKQQQQQPRRYLSFEPDRGGWNNIRMEFEIMFVLAAATGRTLIMPPNNPIYLLNKGQNGKPNNNNNMRSLQSFFHTFNDVVSIISMEDFFTLEVLNKHTYPLPTDMVNISIVTNAVQNCEWYKYSNKSCFVLNDYLTSISNYSPNWHGEHDCLIMDDTNWWFRDMNSDGSERDEDGEEPTRQHQKKKKQRIQRFCGSRLPVYYNTQIHTAPLIHIRSHTKNARLLVHYYAFIYFTNPIIDNYYKRLVRDRVRYSNDIFCAAGKIVKSLITESGNNAGYYSMHIRRGKFLFSNILIYTLICCVFLFHTIFFLTSYVCIGDFQWPKQRLSAEEWYTNTQTWLTPDAGHLLYIATDETNRTWFSPLMEHYTVRFLDDYTKLAGLDKLDPNFVGMIDQVVASRGWDFVGTYFSSFSAYIGK
jgi:hypothetical protein